jgi:Asp-tRNA(Asn)/Glu-tRNA(Gln) amidotransferase A subunit family amidase
MAEPFQLSATEAARAIADGTLTCEALTASCLERIEERDDAVGAWMYLDRDAALIEARRIDKAGGSGLIRGVPVGVKDIIDTADMPTTHGSSIYALNRPNRDAACVAATRAAGGLVLGKTVTTEFAWRNPGKTRNPNNPAHTPGGSSSGSAAGVADKQMPLAFGTQTAGSVIRPAAYCGAVGFKPSFGTYDRTGVKELSGYLDTVGHFARHVADVALFDAALRGGEMADLTAFDGRAPKFGLMVPYRVLADTVAQSNFDKAWQRAEHAGATVVDLPSSAEMERMGDVHNVIMTAEAGRSLAWEYEFHSERLVRFYRESIAIGQAVSDDALVAARADMDRFREGAGAVFNEYDALLTLPAPGEAPVGLAATGDPAFNKLWTMLGWPCVTVPSGTGDLGLPLGIQVVGPFGGDARTLAAAAWLEKALAQ